MKFSDVHFVDDNVAHFPKLLKYGVHCYLAGWGYSNNEQRNYAQSISVVIPDEGNFYNKFAKNLKL